MTSLHLTPHAILRMSQRGVGLDDIEIVESIGTEVEGGYLVRRKDVHAFEEQLKKLGDRARRLEGQRIVVKDDAVITAYHARKGQERRLLRSADDRSLSM
jgi:hypothetical protein